MEKQDENSGEQGRVPPVVTRDAPAMPSGPATTGTIPPVVDPAVTGQVQPGTEGTVRGTTQPAGEQSQLPVDTGTGANVHSSTDGGLNTRGTGAILVNDTPSSKTDISGVPGVTAAQAEADRTGAAAQTERTNLDAPRETIDTHGDTKID